MQELKANCSIWCWLRNIDIKTATENGVKVCNVPAYSEEVAEHTMALMFALARNLKRADIHVREQCYGIILK